MLRDEFQPDNNCKNVCLSFYVRSYVPRKQGEKPHWSSEAAFGKRAYFATMSNPALLRIEKLMVADQGVYRCRVTFKDSPTRNIRVNLTVIGKC